MNIQTNKTVLKRYFIISNSNQVLPIYIVHILTIYMYCIAISIHYKLLLSRCITVHAACVLYLKFNHFYMSVNFHVSQYSRDILLMYLSTVHVNSYYADWCTIQWFTWNRYTWIDVNYNLRDIVIRGLMYNTIVYMIL